MAEEKTVLIVDDDEDICCNVRDILEDLGYRADTAHDGPSALRLVQEKSYDVALLDFKMPGMDGATLYKNIKRMRPETVAIMVTAYAGDDGIERARDAGTWRVLRKPVRMDELLQLVDKAAQDPVVLVVDDDPDFCDNLWQLLRQRELRVRIAHSEAEGTQQAELDSLQGAIVDLRLGHGDGRNVIATIRAKHPHAKVILVTGQPEPLPETKADLVIKKPIDVSLLLDQFETTNN